MIPKIIHYCWFGRNEKNDTIKKCIQSWKKYCPDYQIIEWNEDNFDVNAHPYTKAAYESRKYAFVSDYLRLYVLYNYGGIYVDADLEIRKDIDIFLNHSAFSSFESINYIPTAIMGAVKQHIWIKMLFDNYASREFTSHKGKMELAPNVVEITEITKEKFGLELNNQYQVLPNDIHIYPKEYFCVNTFERCNYSIHHFSGSWVEKECDKQEYLKYKKYYSILNKLLSGYLDEVSIMNISSFEEIHVYGFGSIGKLLVHYLLKHSVRIGKIINSTIPDISEYLGIPIIESRQVVDLDENSAIIITPVYDFCNICDELRTLTKADIYSIEYLLDINILF